MLCRQLSLIFTETTLIPHYVPFLPVFHFPFQNVHTCVPISELFSESLLLLIL